MINRRSMLLIALCLLFTVSLTTSAQINLTDFVWQSAGYQVQLPADWPEPVISDTGEIQRLTLTSPDEDPITIQIDYQPLNDAQTAPLDLSTLVTVALQTEAIDTTGTYPIRWLGQMGLQSDGYSADDATYGYGRIVQLDTATITLVMTTPAENRDAAHRLTNWVAATIMPLTASFRPMPDYGVLWFEERFADGGTSAFIDIAGLDVSGDIITLADGLAGIVTLSARDGTVRGITPVEQPFMPLALARNFDGIYISDLACNCVRQLSPDQADWHTLYSASAPDGARSLATLGEERYITDSDGQQIFVKEIGADFDTTLTFEPALIDQPLLASNSRDLYALATPNTIYEYRVDHFAEHLKLDAPLTSPVSFAVTDTGAFIVLDASGVLYVFDDAGQIQGQIGQTSQLGRVGLIYAPRAVAVSSDNVIYWADADGAYGAITAVHPFAESTRLGTFTLAANHVVQGILSPEETVQIWAFDGQSGDRVTLTAISQIETGALDVALRLYDPSGTEIAFAENDTERQLLNPADAQIEINLPVTGRYHVAVEQQFDAGTYALGLALPEVMSSGEVRGMLSDALPVARWIWEGQAGTEIRIGHQAEGGSLDPFLRLFNPRGDMVIEQDDTAGDSFTRDALTDPIPLSFNGGYLIEATRAGGVGRYRLQVQAE